MSLPYKHPVKVNVFHGRTVLRDPNSREVVELSINIGGLDHAKRLTELAGLIRDLLNGRKKMNYNPVTKDLDVEVDLNAPDTSVPVVAFVPPVKSVEIARVEKILAEEPVVVARVERKRRGRPPKS